MLQILIGIGELLLTPNNGDAAQDHAYRIYKRKDRSVYERWALRPLHDTANASKGILAQAPSVCRDFVFHCLPLPYYA